jgi:hypothetical protein
MLNSDFPLNLKEANIARKRCVPYTSIGVISLITREDFSFGVSEMKEG